MEPQDAIVEHALEPFQAFWVADLAREFGFTDIDGSIPDAEKLHAQLKQGAPAFWREVLGD